MACPTAGMPSSSDWARCSENDLNQQVTSSCILIATASARRLYQKTLAHFGGGLLRFCCRFGSLRNRQGGGVKTKRPSRAARRSAKSARKRPAAPRARKRNVSIHRSSKKGSKTASRHAKPTVSRARAATPARNTHALAPRPRVRPRPLPSPMPTRHVAPPRPILVTPARSMPPGPGAAEGARRLPPAAPW